MTAITLEQVSEDTIGEVKTRMEVLGMECNIRQFRPLFRGIQLVHENFHTSNRLISTKSLRGSWSGTHISS